MITQKVLWFSCCFENICSLKTLQIPADMLEKLSSKCCKTSDLGSLLSKLDFWMSVCSVMLGL